MKKVCIGKGKSRLKSTFRGNKLQVQLMIAIAKHCQPVGSCEVPFIILLKVVKKVEGDIEFPEALLIESLDGIIVNGRSLVISDIGNAKAIITKEAVIYFNKNFGGGRRQSKAVQQGRRIGKK